MNGRWRFALPPPTGHLALIMRDQIGAVSCSELQEKHTMGHGHPHHHDHAGTDVPPALDLSVLDGELAPADVSRRGFLRSAGLLGAGAAATVLATPGSAHAAEHGDRARTAQGGFRWLAGDHNMLGTPKTPRRTAVFTYAGSVGAIDRDYR